jgi:hypothetical protein
MRSNFRTGPLLADPDCLETIPRTAIISALVRHATSLPIHGEAIVTHHEHEGMRFRIETDADRQRTSLRLQ